MPSHTDVVLEVIIGALPQPHLISAIHTSADAVRFWWGCDRWRVDLNLYVEKVVNGGCLRSDVGTSLMGALLKKEWELRTIE